MAFLICLTGIVGSALILLVYALIKSSSNLDRMMNAYSNEFKPEDKR